MTPEKYQEMRFRAACAAIQGIVSDQYTLDEAGIKESDSDYPQNVSKLSVELADTLLKELGVEEPK